MKPALTFVLVWLVTGAGAVAFSILGAAAGTTMLFVGALAGGPVGASLAVAIASWFRWLLPGTARRATLGAIAGFAIAAPIAAFNLHGPVIPVLACALSGVGALVGERLAVKS